MRNIFNRVLTRKVATLFCAFLFTIQLLRVDYEDEASHYADENRRNILKKPSVDGYSSIPKHKTQNRVLCSDSRTHMICFCPNNVTITSEAECWISSTDLHKDSEEWKPFENNSDYQKLEFTVLQSGALDFFPYEIIRQMAYLKSFNLGHAKLHSLPPFAFGNLSDLQNLTVANNSIRILEKFAFANHPSLINLDLSGNEITYMHNLSFSNLPNLNILNISNNRLDQLHDKYFEELTKLTVLYAIKNKISSLHRDTFCGLGNLDSLLLSYNNLTSLKNCVFTELWSVRSIMLDHNQLVDLEPRSFDGLPNLKFLMLNYNNLKHLGPAIFAGAPLLALVNLQNNVLDTITVVNISPFFDTMLNDTFVLLIEYNPFMCDCRLAWLTDLYERTLNVGLHDYLERIYCYANYNQHSPKKKEIEVMNEYDDERQQHAQNAIEVVPEEVPDVAPDLDLDVKDKVEVEAEERYFQVIHIPVDELYCPKEYEDEATELPILRSVAVSDEHTQEVFSRACTNDHDHSKYYGYSFVIIITIIGRSTETIRIYFTYY